MKDGAKVCWSVAPLTQFGSGTCSVGTGTEGIAKCTRLCEYIMIGISTLQISPK